MLSKCTSNPLKEIGVLLFYLHNFFLKQKMLLKCLL